MAACRGKTALVTNATHASARTAAIALAESGAQVLLHEQRSSRHAQVLVEQLRDAGGIAKAIAVDTSSADGLQRLAQQTQGIVGARLDVLVLVLGLDAPSATVQVLLPILCNGSSVIVLSPTAKAVRKELPNLVALLQPRGVRVNALELSGASTAAITYLASNESIGLTGATLRAKPRGRGAVARAAAGTARRENAR